MPISSSDPLWVATVAERRRLVTALEDLAPTDWGQASLGAGLDGTGGHRPPGHGLPILHVSRMTDSDRLRSLAGSSSADAGSRPRTLPGTSAMATRCARPPRTSC